jgi:hypothetical protein
MTGIAGQSTITRSAWQQHAVNSARQCRQRNPHLQGVLADGCQRTARVHSCRQLLVAQQRCQCRQHGAAVSRQQCVGALRSGAQRPDALRAEHSAAVHQSGTATASGAGSAAPSAPHITAKHPCKWHQTTRAHANSAARLWPIRQHQPWQFCLPSAGDLTCSTITLVLMSLLISSCCRLSRMWVQQSSSTV